MTQWALAAARCLTLQLLALARSSRPSVAPFKAPMMSPAVWPTTCGYLWTVSVNRHCRADSVARRLRRCHTTGWGGQVLGGMGILQVVVPRGYWRRSLRVSGVSEEVLCALPPRETKSSLFHPPAARINMDGSFWSLLLRPIAECADLWPLVATCLDGSSPGSVLWTFHFSPAPYTPFPRMRSTWVARKWWGAHVHRFPFHHTLLLTVPLSTSPPKFWCSWPQIAFIRRLVFPSRIARMTPTLAVVLSWPT